MTEQPTQQKTTTDTQRDDADHAGDNGPQRDADAGQQAAPLPSHLARSAGGQKQFTQAEVDRIVSQRVSEEKALADKAVREAEERAGKSELEAAQLDIEKYKQAAEQATRQAADTILSERINAMVSDSDVRKDRRDRLAASINGQIDRAELLDLDPIKQREAIATLISDELAAVPEWKQSGVPASGGGQTRAPAGSQITPDQWRAMGPVERGELFEKSPNEYADLVQQERAAATRAAD